MTRKVGVGVFAKRILTPVVALALLGEPLVSAAPAPAPEGTSEDVASARYEYLNRSRAEQKASELRDQGQRATVEIRQRRVTYRTLQLRVFQDWSVAKRIESRVREAGIDALVINDPYERGYAVSAGAFLTDDNLAQQERRLRELGFRQMAVVPMRGALTRYVVVAAAPPAPEPARPSVPAEMPQRAEAPLPEPAPEAEPEVAVPSGEPEAAPQVLVFGPPSDPLTAYGGARPGPSAKSDRFHVGIEQLRLEGGWLSDSDQPVDGRYYAHGRAAMEWRPSSAWELRAGARVDGYRQTGNPDFSDVDADYDETYIRYRGDRYRVTAGAQTVIWGRVDEIPPSDRLSVQDVRRFVLDDLAERRLAVPALRLETFQAGLKLDALWVPEFRAAEMPELDSIWSPVDRTDGRLIGIEPNPSLAALVRNGSFTEDEHGSGGGGLRLSRSGEGLDVAVTAQRVRHSLPYYELDPAARAVLLSGGDTQAAVAAANGPTFVARHPLTWVFGGDLGFEANGATWRFEAAYLTDVPVTTSDLRMETVKGIDWVAGVEFYPGDANARVNLQLAGHHLLDAPAILDREDAYSFNGAIENVFDHNRWRAKLRFSVGLDEKDLYLNPEIAYIAAEPHEFYVGAHYFDGDPNTAGGFHDDHDLITVGWRARF